MIFLFCEPKSIFELWALHLVIPGSAHIYLRIHLTPQLCTETTEVPISPQLYYAQMASRRLPVAVLCLAQFHKASEMCRTFADHSILVKEASSLNYWPCGASSDILCQYVAYRTSLC